MILNLLCPPALIYLILSFIDIITTTYHGNYQLSLVKVSITILLTLLLQLLCIKGLNIVAWLLVFIPFITYTYIVSIILHVFGINPDENEKLKTYLVN